MLYLADNLAYIPFTVLDEPLFVIHSIDIMVSVSGSNVLQAFKEALLPPPSAEERLNLETGKTEYIYDEDLDDDHDSVLSRLPKNTSVLNTVITASQGCMLLLVLKEHLKDFYGLSYRYVQLPLLHAFNLIFSAFLKFAFLCHFSKIQHYSPNDTSKAFDRQVTRRANVRFNPSATIEILKRGSLPEVLDDEQKREMVQKMLQVCPIKLLMTSHAVV